MAPSAIRARQMRLGAAERRKKRRRLRCAPCAIEIKEALDEIGDPPERRGPGDGEDAAASGMVCCKAVKSKYRLRKRENAQLDSMIWNGWRPSCCRTSVCVNGIETPNSSICWWMNFKTPTLRNGRSFARWLTWNAAAHSLLSAIRSRASISFAAPMSAFSSACAIRSPIWTRAANFACRHRFAVTSPLIAQYNALFAAILLSCRSIEPGARIMTSVFDKPMSAERAEPPVPAGDRIAVARFGRRATPITADDVAKQRGREPKALPADDMRRWEAYEIARRIKRDDRGWAVRYTTGATGCNATPWHTVTSPSSFSRRRKLTLYEDILQGARRFLTLTDRRARLLRPAGSVGYARFAALSAQSIR